MDQNDPEIKLIFALQTISNIQGALDILESQVKDGLKGIQEIKLKRKRSKRVDNK